MAAASNRFLLRTRENADLNQYWYSKNTITAIVEEVVASTGRVAFLSTPSVYFSVPAEVRSRCTVFDFDTQWKTDPGYVFYDFNKPEDIPAELHHQFSMVVIDPPFITREVWEKYTTAAKLLLVNESEAKVEDADAPVMRRVLATTIAENADMMKELLGVTPTKFKPSIPNLVYQYNLYTNYSSEALDKLNPEIPE